MVEKVMPDQNIQEETTVIQEASALRMPQRVNAPQISQEVAQDEDADDDSLPFPNARVVRMIRDEMQHDKQIRSEVKEAVNIWLGNLLRKLAKEMDSTPYGSIGMADFLRATKPYDMIQDIVKDRERILASLEKLKHDADHIQREMNRFFVAMTGKGAEEPQQ